MQALKSPLRNARSAMLSPAVGPSLNAGPSAKRGGIFGKMSTGGQGAIRRYGLISIFISARRVSRYTHLISLLFID